MLTLLIGILALVAWVIFAFIVKVGSGAIHLLVAIGATCIVRWWALRVATPRAQ